MKIDQNKFSRDRGAEIIRAYMRKLPDTPGVYRMLSEKGEALYVGKAKSLKKRVASYTRPEALPFRLQRMVAATRVMEFVHTHTEAEALLLESNLIKKLKPRFNVLLRDDKSFPYIFISSEHDFPRLEKHRGAKTRKGQYYGPFASAGDVNRTINILQRVFLLRTCSDREVEAANRPCLNYHMKRCAGPCAGKISKEDYAKLVQGAHQFLSGKSQSVKEDFAMQMQAASEAQDFERAAELRDRIRTLSAIQARQDINVEGLGNVDVMAMVQKNAKTCVQVFFFRAGRNYGNRSYFPRHDKDEEPEHVIAAFMAQFYENKPVPPEILVNIMPVDQCVMEEAFSNKAEVSVHIRKPQRGNRRRVVDFVEKNAHVSLDRDLAEKASEAKLLKGAAELFGMEGVPERIEVYDNSHISGTNMVGGMIVAGPEGFDKSAYRKFNIKTAGQADDYAMMREVLGRRFKKALKDIPDMAGENWPDLLLIDGGKGQLRACRDVLEEYGVLNALTLVAISKGPDRNAGREQFHMTGRKAFQLPVNDPVLYYLQRLRDEAHRYAIGAHRARRQKQMQVSSLDNIPGVGAKRKKALLHYFGSSKGVEQAGVDDLQKVEGISLAVAQKIYDYFH